MSRNKRSADTSAKNHPVLVKNYGLYWSRELVDWRRRVLNGRRSKRSKSFNFWHQCGIYVLYSADNQPIYFGQAGIGSDSKLGARLKQHQNDNLSDLWQKFSWYGFRAVTKNGLKELLKSQPINVESEVDLLEAILISILPSSLRNKQDGKWKKIRAHRYHQEVNEFILRMNNKEYGAFRTLEERVEILITLLRNRKNNYRKAYGKTR